MSVHSAHRAGNTLRQDVGGAGTDPGDQGLNGSSPMEGISKISSIGVVPHSNKTNKSRRESIMCRQRNYSSNERLCI